MQTSQGTFIQSFAESLTLSLCLPFAYQKQTGVITTRELERIDCVNNAVLDIVLYRSENDHNGSDLDEQIQKRLHLTEAKLDLTLYWLSKLLSLESELPPVRMIDINTRGVQFHADNEISEGDVVQVKLYIDSLLNEPVRLDANVFSVAGGKVTAEFKDINTLFRDKLDKYIFRAHRRAIADNKRKVTVDPAQGVGEMRKIL